MMIRYEVAPGHIYTAPRRLTSAERAELSAAIAVALEGVDGAERGQVIERVTLAWLRGLA